MSVKTSFSDPLRIDSLALADRLGTIGMTICPGRKGSSMAGGSWDRDLDADLAVVRAWAPDIIISLLEDHEFSLLGIPEFRNSVESARLPWVFLPIVDGGIPDRTFTDKWSIVGPRTRNILRRGGRVLIHCRAGLGRTGLLAATILVELGEPCETAIRHVRNARLHTIETEQQKRFVESQQPLPKPPTRNDAIAGCVYGAAIGDALGSAFEFVSAREIAEYLGEPCVRRYYSAMSGSLLFPREPGQPTDDTAMALSVAGVIANGGVLTAERFAHAFLDDLDRNTGSYGAMFWEGGPGGATTRALRRLQTGALPATCGDVNDGGNGAAMRAYPVGFLGTRDDVLSASAIQAKVTHGHPAAIAAAQAVSALVFDALSGFEPELSVPRGIEDPTFVEAWKRAHRLADIDPEKLPDHLLNIDMSGWETVAGAHSIALLYKSDPNRAITVAAASGRDTDTISTIVGAIVGARCGLGRLDSNLISALGSSDLIGAAVARLTEKK